MVQLSGAGYPGEFEAAPGVCRCDGEKPEGVVGKRRRPNRRGEDTPSSKAGQSALTARSMARNYKGDSIKKVPQTDPSEVALRTKKLVN